MSDKVVFTRHALERMALRSIARSQVISVIQKPDATYPTDKPETTKFIRTLNDRQLQVIGRYLPDQNKTLIISVWVRGEEDPEPLVWTLIAFPFRVLWRLLQLVWKKQ